MGFQQRSGAPRRPARTFRASARGRRFAIIAAQFHAPIARQLVRGAVAALRRCGAAESQIRLWGVPGAFELPVVAARVARSRPRPHAIIALGALIRGETPQYDVLAHAVAQGLTAVSVKEGLPVTFGVIVSTTLAQAAARAGGSAGNRGAEAALAAVAVLRVLEALKRPMDDHGPSA